MRTNDQLEQAERALRNFLERCPQAREPFRGMQFMCDLQSIPSERCEPDELPAERFLDAASIVLERAYRMELSNICVLFQNAVQRAPDVHIAVYNARERLAKAEAEHHRRLLKLHELVWIK